MHGHGSGYPSVLRQPAGGELHFHEPAVQWCGPGWQNSLYRRQSR